MKDAANIGSQKGIQNPEDFFRRTQGTYKDNVDSTSQKELIDYRPKGPDPSPLQIRR